MRKALIAGTIIVLAGIGAAVPYITGTQAETAFRTNLEALAQHPQLETRLTRYDRGWLGATASSRVTLILPDDRIRLRLRHNVRHGPRPGVSGLAAMSTRPVIPDEHQATVRHYFGEAAPLTADLHIDFTGNQTLTVDSPAFVKAAHTDPDTEVEWGGLSGQVKIAADHGHVDVVVALGDQ